ncbi:DNA replication/repair protein RecF [Oceanospirillum linum]|uniref:DNA replication and repair protein RecF n=1 Tax=Oceanospirillum linum TaxID=966 RepID=A0A1T1HCA7_OCELI|nr:DNA replication/repair protein RecF [Oceanospirillum linum]OOV87370.1 DNA replication/repair protein RecF [Oceanospirillum linum]SEF82936.1 DNA replication and repair protein RecF [Oleiphilus messinensis]SMP19549.1 DNA replication and repair protein RecF [Oceanospirillum linum]
MSIRRLDIAGFRNLTSAQLQPASGVNLIIGENGAGKTSILEAISVLSTGRSFRASRTPAIINFEQDAYTLFAEVFNALAAHQQIVPIGISRNRQGEQQIRIAGQQARTASQLAELLPVQTINSESFQLLEGSPKVRRQFVDWGVFHVEHVFFPVWQAGQKALKQRNKLLKYGKMQGSAQHDTWDEALAGYAEQIDLYRARYVEMLIPEFKSTLSELAFSDEVSLSYYRGWDRTVSCLDALRQNREKDLALGFTQSGPHRADLKIRVNKLPAVDVLSRGQQKLVVCALLLAQGRLMQKVTGKQSIYLVDDLPAELDSEHRNYLCQVLEEMQCQVFITSVEADALIQSWSASTPMTVFHVKHGELDHTPGPAAIR